LKLKASSKLIAAAAVSLLAAFSAQAESYEGVHAPVSANNRVDVSTQAVVAARSENPYAEAAFSRVAPAPIASTARAAVRSEAVAAARSPNPYAEGYGQGVAQVEGTFIDRATVRAEARAAAHGSATRALSCAACRARAGAVRNAWRGLFSFCDKAGRLRKWNALRPGARHNLVQHDAATVPP